MSKMLEDYIHYIAKTGDTIFPWHRIRHFMQHMLETVRETRKTHARDSKANKENTCCRQ